MRGSVFLPASPGPARAKLRVHVRRRHQEQVDQRKAVVSVREHRRSAAREEGQEFIVNDGQRAPIGESESKWNKRASFVQFTEDGDIHGGRLAHPLRRRQVRQDETRRAQQISRAQVGNEMNEMKIGRCTGVRIGAWEGRRSLNAKKLTHLRT